MSKRLSIVVPYRNRPDHLARFLPHLVRFFAEDETNRDIPFAITVVEQAGDDPFNAGMLCNVGFLLTRDRADAVCFHDVDYLPIRADYSYPRWPTRLIWHGADQVPLAPGSDVVIRHSHGKLFGGAVLFRRGHFERVNGYSNEYWGWGFQDTDLRARCLAEGLFLRFRDGVYEGLRHVNQGLNADLSLNAVGRRNRDRFRRKLAGMAWGGHRQDGLTTARFDIAARRPAIDPATGRPWAHVEIVTVLLPAPPPEELG